MLKMIEYREPVWRDIKLSGGRLTGTFPWEAQWLINKIGSLKGDVLEIGTYKGSTARELALAFLDRTIHCVDSCLPWYGLRQEEIGQDSVHLPNVKITISDSRSFTYPENLGLIFIDADHFWAGVKADTEKALEYFRTRHGSIVWHDYDPTHEVMPYLEWLATWNGLDIRFVQCTQLAVLDL